MPSTQEIDARERLFTATQLQRSKVQYYEGPILYRGEKINWKHSIKRVVKTLRRSLKRSQFASLNLVGIPGSGKGVLTTNICTDLIEDEEKENGEHYEMHWKKADDLRNLGEVLESLPKGTNNIIVFDDVSKALEKLSSSEQAEVFNQLTTTRHITGGRLLIISCYHYSFANLKSVKSQSVVTIYTSCTTTEYGNISTMMNGPRNQRVLTKFAKIYEDAFMKGRFELKISKQQKRMFVDGEPFRPCLVVNLSRVHIGLFLKLDNQYSEPDTKKERANTEKFVARIKSAFPNDYRLVLRITCMLKGHSEAVTSHFWSCFKMVQELSAVLDVNYDAVTLLVKDPKQKKQNKKRKLMRDTTELIIKDSKEFPEPAVPIITDVDPSEEDVEDFDEEDEFAEFHNINKEPNQTEDDGL